VQGASSVRGRVHPAHPALELRLRAVEGAVLAVHLAARGVHGVVVRPRHDTDQERPAGPLPAAVGGLGSEDAVVEAHRLYLALARRVAGLWIGGRPIPEPALVEFERELVRKRRREGIALAKQRACIGGGSACRRRCTWRAFSVKPTPLCRRACWPRCAARHRARGGSR
jgi:hypothetical protein